MGKSLKMDKLGMKVDQLSDLNVDGEINQGKLVWMKTDLFEKEMIFAYDSGSMNRINLSSFEVEKEIVHKFLVDPQCLESNKILDMLVTRSSQKIKNRRRHFLTFYKKGKNRFINKYKGKKPPVDPNTFYLFNKVLLPFRAKFVKIIDSFNNLIVCLENNALLMMDLKYKDFNPNSMIMRGERGKIQCMEVDHNQKFLFLGISLKTVEIFNIEEMELKFMTRIFVGISPTCISLSVNQIFLTVGSYHDFGGKVFVLRDLEEMGEENLKKYKNLEKIKNIEEVKKFKSLEKLENVDNLKDLLPFSEVLKNNMDDLTNDKEIVEKMKYDDIQFDSDEVMKLKRNFRLNKNKEILKCFENVNRELLKEQNMEQDRFIEAKLIESEIGVPGLNKIGKKIFLISNSSQQVLKELIRLMNYLNVMYKSLSRGNVNKIKARVTEDKDILLFSIEAKIKVVNGLINNLYDKKSDVIQEMEFNIERNNEENNMHKNFEIKSKEIKSQMEKLFSEEFDQNQVSISHLKQIDKVVNLFKKKLQKKRNKQVRERNQRRRNQRRRIRAERRRARQGAQRQGGQQPQPQPAAPQEQNN
jgi:hypothetical protein